MDWLKKNPEKVILMVVALLALGLGVRHILAVQNYPEKFDLPPVAQKGDEIPEPPEGMVEKSATLVELPLYWADKSIPIPGTDKSKEVPLLRSVMIVEKDGALYDLENPNEDPLRPPVSNQWLLSHDLEILDPNVLEQDPDSDGYSNLEEWEDKTNPLKKDSHPPYTDKLRFVSRKQRNMVLRFSANNAPEFQVAVRTRGGRLNEFFRVGESFLNGKFTIVDYTEKRGMKDGIERDLSELTVRDNAKNENLTLVLREDTSWPTYFAELEFLLARDPEDRKFFVKEGDPFTLSADPSTEYVLLEVTTDSATIEESGTDEEIVIEQSG